MQYISTRGGASPLSFSRAVEEGLAPDGGLFLPRSLPQVGGELPAWERLGYADLAFAFLSRFATDVDAGALKDIIDRSYAAFGRKDIAPLRPLGRNRFVLELFHGPTLAFKDFGLQWLGRLSAHLAAAKGDRLNVLGATSGDTGAAAIHGFLGIPGTAIFILYPDGRVAPLQERQMACTGAPNVHALAIDGTFDDAQSVLKTVLADQGLRAGHRLSTVNSINLARVLAQCVYYLYAWLRFSPGDRERVEFVVPTGNFGNVLAGWMLTRMGVPIPGFKVATNQNDILYRFFTSGEYRTGPVHPSFAPSMDIQVASNFERFLYYALDGDTARVGAAMRELKASGGFRIPDFESGLFSASRCEDARIPGIIRGLYDDCGYILDPHTACGFADLNPERLSVVLATASPAKFPDTIREAIGKEPTDPSLEALKSLPIVKHRLRADSASVRAYIEAHAA